MPDTLGTLALVSHVLIAALWLGGMVYSLLVVQPKMARYFADADEEHELFAATLAAGNRRTVLALIAALVLTGLLLLGYADPGPVHLLKSGLLVAATAVFCWVSWRHWPRRVFAVPEERAGLRGQLRAAAWVMVALVGTAFVLSVALR